MEQFKLQYTEYAKEGYLTNIVHAEYFSIVDALKLRYNKLKNEYWYDGNGEKTNIKRYKVEVMISGYKTVDNPQELFAQFDL